MFGEQEIPHIEIDEETRESIKEVLSQMREPVELMFFTTRDCAGRSINLCVPTEEFLDVLTQLAPPGKLRVRKIRYETNRDEFLKYKVEPSRVPVIYMLGDSIRYLGAPLEEEAKGFIETIIRISTGETGLSPRTVTKLARLRGMGVRRRVEILTIVTPACPYCPHAALLANMFAYASGGKIVSTVVEAFEESDIADFYHVTAVPAIVIKLEDEARGSLEFIGVPSEEELLGKVYEALGLEEY